jgi:hypothetical protein
MPTGYTADIKDGISFEQFVWTCARAFGALVMMRDDSMDAPIPERFEPSDTYKKWLLEERAKLGALVAMSVEEVAAAAEAAYLERHASWARRRAEKTELRNRYSEMLAKVVQWEPPTPEHQGLKDFMAQQLRESIDFDCGEKYDDEPQRLEPTDWHNQQVENTRKAIARHLQSHTEEHQRAESRNGWLKALRDSVPPPTTTEASDGQP